MAAPRRWLFGDQLGPHFVDGDDQHVLLIESQRVFARRRFHRQKAHLVLSAMRHRAAELGDRCRYVRSDTYRSALRGRVSVCHPTSRAALRLVESLDRVEVLPARGFATSMADFARWAEGRAGKRLVMEDFYRRARRAHDVLMDGDQPAGGRWNFDRDNRTPPPRSGRLDTAEPWWPVEDEIDEQVRHDLDSWQRSGVVSFIGRDGPRRFAATRAEALQVLDRFVDGRLNSFGPYEDAMLATDPWMSHSLLSAPMNLGLLDPLDVVNRVEQAYRDGGIPIASAEGFVRQIIGWRDYVWHLYWYQPESYRRRNALQARRSLPDWFAELDADAVQARCLSGILADVRDHGWVHHIPRLMVLGNYAMQRGWRPDEVTDWFHRAFVDGYDWVMVPNVVGMSQYADGGLMMTKPYAGGGSYIDRMSDYCGGCRYDPKVRTGERACPFTAGYWAFMFKHREKLAGNQRIAQPLRSMWNLKDLDELVAQENERGSRAP
ncbi:MAG TPA: cryptochrome/photolyase family protein [Jatrophihabitans sp.]|nr:cryptochrome/photolyase family protein [Jatrophihabitans sp.]